MPGREVAAEEPHAQLHELVATHLVGHRHADRTILGVEVLWRGDRDWVSRRGRGSLARRRPGSAPRTRRIRRTESRRVCGKHGRGTSLATTRLPPSWHLRFPKDPTRAGQSRGSSPEARSAGDSLSPTLESKLGVDRGPFGEERVGLLFESASRPVRSRRGTARTVRRRGRQAGGDGEERTREKFHPGFGRDQAGR